MGPLVSGVLTFQTFLHKDAILNVGAASTCLQFCHLGFEMSAVGCSSLHQSNASMISAQFHSSMPSCDEESALSCRWVEFRSVQSSWHESTLARRNDLLGW